jgi:ferritin-like metal-binding protein YciE
MAKSSASKKVVSKPAKTSAAFSKKSPANATAAVDNSSKYQPTEDADMNMQLLDPEDGLLKLFTDSVKDLYWAENHLVKALPKMAKSASSKQLSKAILTHLDQTKAHVERLQQVFEILGKKPQAKKCDAMEGLTMEGEGVIENTDAGTPARNLGIIMASQKVEHYEISAYTGLIKLANKLGLADVANILSETLTEEQLSDQILAGIADEEITVNNQDA